MREAYIAMAAASGAAVCLAGVLMGRALGVDPSRKTPAAEQGAGAGFLPGAYVLACAYLFSATLHAPAKSLGEPALVWCAAALAAMLAGTAGFVPLFASLRHEGRDIAAVAGDGIGLWMERTLRIVTAAAAAPCAAMLLAQISGLLAPGQADGFPGPDAAMSWSMLALLSSASAPALLGARLGSERHAGMSAYAGAVLACAAACAMQSAAAKLLPEGTLLPVYAVMCACAAALFMHLLGSALCGLLACGMHARRNRRIRRGIGAVVPLLCAALSFAPLSRVRAAVCALCLAGAWLSMLCCAAWLRRIGRHWLYAAAVPAVMTAVLIALL